MPSLLAWLDHSDEDHRRMRELVTLFAQEESRDELGIGAIRDAFSDCLFPGASVIQTRARYLLFVPWIYRAAEQRNLTGIQLRARVEAQERRLARTSGTSPMLLLTLPFRVQRHCLLRAPSGWTPPSQSDRLGIPEDKLLSSLLL